MPRSFPLALFLALCISIAACDSADPREAELIVENVMDDGPGSLRHAVSKAGPDDVITFSAKIKGQKIVLQRPINLTRAITIEGLGVDETIISGGGKTRVFYVGGSSTVKLSNLTIRDGYVSDPFDQGSSGAGIYIARGTVVIDRCLLTGNKAGSDGQSGSGGAIYNFQSATLTISNSLIDSNWANGNGGAILNFGKLEIHRSEISANLALHGGSIVSLGESTLVESSVLRNGFPRNPDGTIIPGNDGGIINDFGTTTIRASTIAFNSGEGIRNTTTGRLMVENSTIIGNGIGISNWSGMVDVAHTTVARNLGIGISNSGDQWIVSMMSTLVAENGIPPHMDGPFDFQGPLTSKGHNLIGSMARGFVVESQGNYRYENILISREQHEDLTDVDPLLADLGSYGGPTQTVPLLPNSPAIDRGSPTSSQATDQRGYSRRANGGSGAPRADIGAFEYGATPVN